MKASVGLNLALDFLPGALAFNPLLASWLDPVLASAIVWFDAYVTNVDRTPRNTNLLIWNKALWLIDHGAALYFQHTWTDYLNRSRSPFSPIKNHVLLPFASALPQVAATLPGLLNPSLLEEIVSFIPDSWLGSEPGFASLSEQRAAYLAYLLNRLEAAPIFVEEAVNARAQLL